LKAIEEKIRVGSGSVIR